MRGHPFSYKLIAGSLVTVLAAGLLTSGLAAAATEQRSGAIGIEGTVSGNPPNQAPTITVPKNGQIFTSLPITVAGLCPSGLLVEVFKNNVFAGSIQCRSGSYSLPIDLFSGRNDLIARAYDNLNQASPDSNLVSVTFNDTTTPGASRLTITSAYAKRGANPGAVLTWPVIITGGSPPYAITADWGDKSTPDLISRAVPGEISLEHIYKQSGIYKVTFKVTDANGTTAFLQVVGIGNGPTQQSSQKAKPAGAVNVTTSRAFWILLILLFPLLLAAFWLGKRYQLQLIRDRLRRGQRPF